MLVSGAFLIIVIRSTDPQDTGLQHCDIFMTSDLGVWASGKGFFDERRKYSVAS